MANSLKVVRACGLALGLAVAFLSVPIMADTSPDRQGSILRFAAACAADECRKDDEYGCTLGELPLVGYKCTRGCPPPPEEKT